MFLFFKAMHFIALIAWFAGMFYIFRIFVYHAENKDKPEVTAIMKVMARRLYKVITMPAMVATFVFGIAMIAVNTGLAKHGWFHIKFLLVLCLAGYTGYAGKIRKRFEADDICLTPKQCRIWNEFPTLFLIAIVFLMMFRFSWGLAG